MAGKRLPIPLYFLLAFLVLFFIRDCGGYGSSYGAFRAAGVPANGIWDFRNYTVAALTMTSAVLLTVISGLNLSFFFLRAPQIRIGLITHYLVEVAMTFAVSFAAVSQSGASMSVFAALGPALVTTTLIQVPWVIYLYSSTKARAAFPQKADELTLVEDSPTQSGRDIRSI